VRTRSGIAALGALLGLHLALVAPAEAAPPQILSTSVVEESVTATGVTLQGSINPNGLPSTYRFEYLTQAAFEGNLEAEPPREAFAGAMPAPATGSAPVGSGTSPIRVSQHLSGLSSETSYRYRLRAVNSESEVAVSVARPFATAPPTNAFELLDHRSWEMVSPIEKDGGAIQAPGTIFGGGVFQAAAKGGSFTFTAADSFGEGAQGAPGGSQYLATRGGSGWTTANITTSLLSGSYGSNPNGVPYQLFSGDLGFGLLSNGERCRGEAGGECPVANPPLPGSGAPAGYRDYYRRTSSGAFESVLTAGDPHPSELGPEQFELRLVAATPDLTHLVLSSCAALTSDATEVAAPGGCNATDQNLYEWSGGGLSLINGLPGGAVGSLTGAAIAAPSGAISADGSRVYFIQGGEIYLSEGGETKTVPGSQGGKFEEASSEGTIAYLVDSGELYRYTAATETLTQLTTGGSVEGVLGMSTDGSKVYYAEAGAIFLRNGSTVTEVAPSAVASDWPAAIGTARVTADGSHLLFLSDAELTGYPNEGETEVFLYGPLPGGSTARLICVSCNPSGERPQGAAAIPGARPNGAGDSAIDAYKPRDLSASGNRVFFETADSLASQDTNKGATDVYEWEAAGEGTCSRVGGCVQLISGGREITPSYFLDADESGGEAFFLTTASLYALDPGSYDVYDAREYGGFAVPESPIPCVADACQVLPEAPEDPTPGTLTSNAGNPAMKVVGGSNRKGKTKKKHKRKNRKKPRRHSRKKTGARG
jgi:hypothetical protein